MSSSIFKVSPPTTQNLLRAIENIGIVSVYGIRYLTTGNVTQQNYIKYVDHSDQMLITLMMLIMLTAC